MVSAKGFSVSVLLVAVLPLASAYSDTNLLTNPGFETGTTSGWSPFGCSISAVTVPHTGSYSCLASGRSGSWSGPSQSLLGLISDGQTCSISGWVRLQNSSSDSIGLTIQQIDDSGTHYHPIQWSTGRDDIWTELSGFFTLNVTGTLTTLRMYFEGPDPNVNFYVDDASVTVTSSGDWETEANERIEQIRKGNFRITAVSPYGSKPPVPDVNIEVHQIKHGFPFGSAINSNISDANYAQFFKNHFEWAVMENESKWYSNEPSQGNVTYTAADNIYNWCAANGITMRGHCIYWEATSVVQQWIQNLAYAQLPASSPLRSAVESRMDSAVNHFKGKFVHWDVCNEMCNNSFFADRLGYSIRPWMFQAAHAIDPNCLLFLNDYNVINGGYNLSAYKQMAYDLAAQGAPIHGLGVQCHMTTGFNPATIKARFDSVAEVNLPIWVTEFDVSQPDENIRADELEDFYRIAFSHPAVKGILMWGFWQDSHWRDDCHIVNSDWCLNEAGRRYEAIRNEWTTIDSSITDNNGSTEFRGFYGKYSVTLTPDGAEPTVAIIDVVPGGPNEFTLELANEPTTCQQVNDSDLTLPADLNGDCYVDYADLLILADQWLSNNPEAIPPNYSPDIYSDEKVDLYDFAALSADWPTCNDPCDPNCTHNW